MKQCVARCLTPQVKHLSARAGVCLTAWLSPPQTQVKNKATTLAKVWRIRGLRGEVDTEPRCGLAESN